MGYKIAYQKLNTHPKINLDVDNQVEIAKSLFPTHELNIWEEIRTNEEEVSLLTEPDIQAAAICIKV